jgi:sugar lactone lactonase YvrE
MRYSMLALILVLLWPAGAVSASRHAETVLRFDPAQGQYPEGVAVDHRGNLYVSLAPRGQIWKIELGEEPSLFASLVDPASLPLDLGALGLAVDPTGQVYAALASFDPTTHGVWRVSRDGSTRQRLPGSEAIQLPNALTFDERGTLYVTDSLAGAIWRIARDSVAELWMQDALLVGIPGLIPGGAPIGANGIAFWKSALFVANTTTMQVLRVPVRADGSAGVPQIAHAFTGTDDFLDGIAVDARGDLYLLVIGQHMLVRLTQAGEVTVLATADDGLDFPASVAIGTSHGTRHRLFVTNFAVFPSADPERPGPGVVAVEAEVTQNGDCRPFDETRHAVCGHFRNFWETHGGLRLFGYPITEAFVDKDGLTVQWFERARFEHHPANAGTEYEVLLGRLGAEIIERDGASMGTAP